MCNSLFFWKINSVSLPTVKYMPNGPELSFFDKEHLNIKGFINLRVISSTELTIELSESRLVHDIPSQ